MNYLRPETIRARPEKKCCPVLNLATILEVCTCSHDLPTEVLAFSLPGNATRLNPKRDVMLYIFRCCASDAHAVVTSAR